MTRALPAEDLVRNGVEDLRAGIESIASLVVSIGYPRLRRLGIEIPRPSGDAPEHRLYRKLSESDAATAHSRYNALIRRLVSYERAAECGS